MVYVSGLGNSIMTRKAQKQNAERSYLVTQEARRVIWKQVKAIET